jgi:ribokinase
VLVVFGSINADLVFRVSALPRAGETVLAPGYAFSPGGKGANQAVAAAKAGADVRFVGRVGDDGFADPLRQVLIDAGVDAGSLWSVPGATGVAIIAVDRAGENQIIVGSGANNAVVARDIPDGTLAPGVTLLCQNELPPLATAEAVAQGKAAGARVILNLAPAGPVDVALLDALDLLVVNEHEARSIVGKEAPPPALARQLSEHHRLSCVVTLGGEGVVVGENGRIWRVPALPIAPVDTTGAGDCFVGVLAAGLDAGLDLEQAIRRAAVAGALACEKLGAQAGQPTATAIDARLATLGATEKL